MNHPRTPRDTTAPDPDDRGGVLLLSHVGFSFLEDLIGALDSRGVKTYVLTSRPLPEHLPERLDDLAAKAYDVHSADSHVLTRADVEDHLAALDRRGERVLGCLTVWEGYRHLMAHANSLLNLPDLAEEQVLALRDKLALRNGLADAGLGRTRATALTPDSLAAHQAGGGRYFVKPVSGIASLGTFALTAATTWADVERIADEARQDPVYASAFAAGVPFLVEDYLPGREFSFEVLVADGSAHLVAVHEKSEVTETAGAVLENACVSPPGSLGPADLAAGRAWVLGLLAHLDLRWGCFHIEARHHEGRWELIEVNPRVGGSLISHSVKALVGTDDLLGLWIDLLLAAARPGPDALGVWNRRLAEISYRPDGTSPARRATFFRVFFGERGRIARIALAEDLPARPVVAQILAKVGDLIDSEAREVFLGQLLWSMPLDERERLLPELIRASHDAIEVQYEM
ncbi:ATP-grasp domain-containing protein [Streptomyces sp. NBC_01551]|uniref:ATP-grasp domain-containing protein n=1 Tax=Streptomyces sp. NBC_01551 TaxID=2975876 RepID=UPI002252CF57|nr:ATP-grasp domain-containing protein [Streptomyces sp. NBC_01551]MCX4527048.1 ATP-grasp domain-containing protein [Streptomyces sp. NBC_01551]